MESLGATGNKRPRTVDFGTPYKRPMSSSGLQSVEVMMVMMVMNKFPNTLARDHSTHHCDRFENKSTGAFIQTNNATGLKETDSDLNDLSYSLLCAIVIQSSRQTGRFKWKHRTKDPVN
ncbi:jg17515 [Pararge aegeria aegeria]|uniref:Jg17515 protein n=1 Tax=Pararge aegeria aegeria TaxID=348720 RepID=A0A8S4QIY4_9NEOP|nr:jg17515 [Pararge aegeria aegeria]